MGEIGGRTMDKILFYPAQIDSKQLSYSLFR